MPQVTRAFSSLWADLVGTSERWGRTILYGVVFGRLAMIPVAVVIYGFAPDTTDEGFTGTFGDMGFADLISALVIAPLLESLIIVFLVWLFGVWLRAPVWLTALLTGAAFVPLHGLVLLSFAVFPIFALMAAIQFNWRRRGREWTGFWIIATIHALGNLSATAFTAVNRLS